MWAWPSHSFPNSFTYLETEPTHFKQTEEILGMRAQGWCNANQQEQLISHESVKFLTETKTPLQNLQQMEVKVSFYHTMTKVVDSGFATSFQRVYVTQISCKLYETSPGPGMGCESNVRE